MLLSDAERYASVIEYGKGVVTKINEGNLKEGFWKMPIKADVFPGGLAGIVAMGMLNLFFNKAIEK